jgi:1,2-diacylglycerol-3-alpha-glucose alpha-1,2-galactosyltransferase
MSILEALGCKKPVLVRDIPLYDSILQGYCMRGKNVDEFTAFIKKIEKDTALYDHWREKAWECHNLYTEETVLSQWIALYKNAYADLTIKKESGECNLWLRKLPQKV